ncbi:MAG: NTP transferase domain-containing protein [Pirellulales bacterium]
MHARNRCLNTLGIVVAHWSDRATRQKLLRRLAGHTLLEGVVRRVTDAARLDTIIVMTDVAAAAELREYVPRDVPLDAEDSSDWLGRFAAAATQYRADGVVAIDAGNPFLDPALVDRLVTEAELALDCDCLRYRWPGGDAHPARLTGPFAEWYRATALERAAAVASRPRDRQQPSRFLNQHADWCQTRLLSLPAGLDQHDVRLTLDVEEDWEHAEQIFDALGHDTLEWQRLVGLLRQQPRLRARMARLNYSPLQYEAPPVA